MTTGFSEQLPAHSTACSHSYLPIATVSEQLPAHSTACSHRYLPIATVSEQLLYLYTACSHSYLPTVYMYIAKKNNNVLLGLQTFHVQKCKKFLKQ